MAAQAHQSMAVVQAAVELLGTSSVTEEPLAIAAVQGAGDAEGQEEEQQRATERVVQELLLQEQQQLHQPQLAEQQAQREQQQPAPKPLLHGLASQGGSSSTPADAGAGPNLKIKLGALLLAYMPEFMWRRLLHPDNTFLK